MVKKKGKSTKSKTNMHSNAIKYYKISNIPLCYFHVPYFQPAKGAQKV